LSDNLHVTPPKEAKVLLLGAGGSGKTSLFKQLTTQPFDPFEPLTHGIRMGDWEIPSKAQTLHLWDFGGQEALHATHPLFFSDHALFLLITDDRTEKNLGYWLNSIQHMSRHSTVLLVINKIDQTNAPTVNQNALLKKYPILSGIYHISCKTGAGIDALKTHLSDWVDTRTALPEDWHRVKTHLLALPEPYLPLERFRGLCNTHGIAHNAQKSLLNTLNELGVLIYYDDFKLSHLILLDPQWFVTGILALINAEAEADGVVPVSELVVALNRASQAYPDDFISIYLIQVMEKFELCFFIDAETLLLPGRLPAQEPERAVAFEMGLTWVFAYTFLPPTLITQLIVHLQHLQHSQRWRYGLVCGDEQNQALIRSDDVAGELLIAITGKAATRRSFLTMIRREILSLKRHYQALEVTEWVPLPGEPSVRVRYVHLLRLEQQGETRFIPEGAAQAVEINNLLHGSTFESPIHAIVQFSVQRIRIKQFKNIQALEIDLSHQSDFLPGHWACLAGVNSAGKSSVLQALNLVLMGEKLAPELGAARLASYCRRDQHGVYDAEIDCTVCILDDAGDETLITLYLPLNATTGLQDKKLRAHPDYDTMRTTWALLHQQLILAYGPNRSLSTYRDSRHSGHHPYVLGQMTLFDPLSQIANLSLLLEQTADDAATYEVLATLLAELLPDAGLTLRREHGLYQFYLGDVVIEPTELPDGFRSTLAWVADLCASWFAKNPAQSDMQGLVMIDEIDLHLHPSLQRLMIPTLRKLLPKIQWIVTTHSPMVLSSFDRHELFVLRADEDNHLMPIDRQITGFSIDQIYEWLMDTPAQSKVIEDQLAAIEQDSGKTLSPQEKSWVSVLIDQSPAVSEAQAKAQQEKRRAFLKKLSQKP